MAACTKDIYWYYYIVVSLVTFFGGLVILIPSRLIWYAMYNRCDDQDSWRKKHKEFNCFSRMRAQAANILSGHGQFSKAVIICVWLVDMASCVLYITEATQYNRDDCGEVIGDMTQYVWLAFSCFFVAHYIIRLTAAPDKCYMWADLYSIVDHFTIGPLFVGLYLNRNWLGLRCLRLLHLLQLPDILQLLHIIKSRNSIRLVQVGSIFSSIWLVSSGFVHICENNGDPFANYENGQRLTYWECVYWLLVTMSTVGFGEISPHTDIGRVFIVLFIMGSFAMFTTIIPELARALGRNARYHKPYKRTYGKKHIIVCGHITTETVTNFIKNFMHEDSRSDNIDVVFVDKNKPGLEMEAFFKRHFNDVKFVQGTVMDLKTLQGIKLRYADACLIIANRGAANPDAEDAANTMRATAVKNYNPDLKVIIQLLQYRNKLNLLHIPNWKWSQSGDEVICVSELKNGILAQNCLAPGVSTLLSNLFTNRSAKGRHSAECMDLYKQGAGNEIYTEEFSDAFIDMTFTQAASICLSQMGIILVAVYIKERNGNTKLKVNPGNSFTITAQTGGLFIAQSHHQVKHVLTYAGSITGRSVPSTPVTLLPNAQSEFNGKIDTSMASSMLQFPSTSDDDTHLEYLESVGSRIAHYSDSKSDVMLDKPTDNMEKEVLDITGMFHWCPPRLLESAVLEKNEARDLDFKDHIVVCLNATGDSPESGLINFIMPLRSSCLNAREIKDIVIVSNPDHVAKEWREISNFPRIYIVPQGRYKRTDLRAVNISRCSMCVIMTTGGHINVDQTLIDNEAILTTLTIKSMFGVNLENRIRAVGVLTNAEAFRREIGVTSDIPTITELEYDCNVVYVDPDDDDDPHIPIYLTAPYACGKTFVASVLDSLLSCTYLNPSVLTLTRALITGGETAEFEKILSEGLGIVRKNTLIDVSSARPRCRLAQLSLSCGPLEKLKHNDTYGELFTLALQTHEILCLGLYRLMDPRSNDPRDRKRVVLCNPDYDLELFTSDRVFVLQPHVTSYNPYPSRDSSSNNTLYYEKSTDTIQEEPEETEEEYNGSVFFTRDDSKDHQSSQL